LRTFSKFLSILTVSFAIVLSSQSVQADTAAQLRKNAANGDVSAQTELGTAFTEGTLVKKNFKRARYWLEKAARQGDAKAQNNLGRLLVFGIGGPVDTINGVKWYEKSASQGEHAAQFNLAYLYHDGRRVDKNMPRAIELYTSAAKDPGYTRPQFRLGEIYRTGDGVVADPKKALFWHREAAQRGHAKSQYELALLISTLHPGDVSDAQAFALLTAASVAGHKKSARKSLALERKLGLRLTPKQRKKLSSSLRLSPQEMVSQGNLYAFTFSKKKQDQRLADFYYTLALAKDEAVGNFGLGVRYMKKGKPVDFALAAQHFKKAADLGLQEANYNLGWLHYTGALATADDTLAFDYITKATSPLNTLHAYRPDLMPKSSTYANLLLAVMYLEGRGTKRDKDKAMVMFSNLAAPFITSGARGRPNTYVEMYALNFMGDAKQKIRSQATNVQYSDEGYLFNEQGSKSPLTVRISTLIGEKSADWEHCGYQKIADAFRAKVIEHLNKARSTKGRVLLMQRIKRAHKNRKVDLQISSVMERCPSAQVVVNKAETLLLFMAYDWGVTDPPKELGIEVVFNGRTLTVGDFSTNQVVKEFKPEPILRLDRR